MSKKKSITIFVILCVIIVLAGVFAVVDFPIGLYDYHGYAKVIKLGLDLKGGVSVVFDVGTTENVDGTVVAIDSDTLKGRVEGAVNRLQSLLVEKGYTEATVSYEMDAAAPTIRVEVPDVDDPERIFTLISRPATLLFVNPDNHDEIYIEGKTDLENAYVSMDSENSNYAVGLKFNDVGTKKFADVTSKLSSNGTTTGYMTILVNGEVLMDKVSVSSTIAGGNASISNSKGYTYAEAYELSTSLQAGTFGVDLEVREQSILGPTLGDNAIRNGLIAGGIGLALVMIFMVIFYKRLGLIADLSLIVYVELLLLFCSILPWVQLTLPGIAGLVLGVGMAVDANIVIFERTKDEYRAGKSLISSINTGFNKGRIAVIDANITTIIGAVVLWVFGGSSIVGFAITLFISIIISMFTALVVSRLLIKMALPFESINGEMYGLKREAVNNVK